MTRSRAILAAVAVVVVGLVGCGDDDGEQAHERISVVVDTDGGADDAMALLYLLRHPDVEVLAITVSGTGLVHCDPGVDNIAGLVALAAPATTPAIACGATQPLAGHRAFPTSWRAQADGRYDGILPAGEAPATATTTTDAATLLADTIEDAGGDVTALTLGPLTNLAASLGDDPELVDAISEVVVMGGAFDVAGNVALEDEPSAAATEWNLYVDPAAAQVVLDSGTTVTFAPLDTQVPIDPYVVRTIADEASSAPARTIADLLTSSDYYTSPAFALWDPVAAAAVADRELFTMTERQARVLTEGEEAGRTVSGSGTAVQLADVVDDDALIAAFLGTLDGRPGPITVERRADATIDIEQQACSVSPTDLAAGPAVLALGTAGLAVVGVLDEGRTADDIESFLASTPEEGPPDWFGVLTPLQGAGATAYVDLEPGEMTVVCLTASDGARALAGIASLTVLTN